MKLSQRLQEERAFVEKSLGDSVICGRCKATLKTFADECTASLSDPCPGFWALEHCKTDFASRSRSRSLHERREKLQDLLPPDPCPAGQHVPCIVHRTGGRDANYYNVCGKCGRQIERGDGEPWATAQEIEDHINEQIAENQRDWERQQYEDMHPEDRWPPRE